MSEETKSVSELVRITASNQQVFLTQIAEHIEKLEDAVVQLKARITEMETTHGNNTEAQ
jgi:hypothetical protein